MKSNLKTQLFITGIAAGCLLLTFSCSFKPQVEQAPAEAENKAAPVTNKPRVKAYPQVSTFAPDIGSFTTRHTAYGEVKAAQNLNLVSEISGRIVELASAFNSGKRVAAGATLLKIEDAQYRQAVASAKASLAAAELALLQQELNQQQAKAEWQRSGLDGQPDSKLAFYEPQLKAAQADYEFALRSLEKALADLDKTVIKAPFNAVIISRSVEIGGFINTGSQLGLLYGSDALEVTLPLSSKAWENLPNQADKSWRVQLSDTDSGKTWSGYVDRIAQNIDNSTRQRSLIVRIDQALDLELPLYPGTFVEADIPGNNLSNAVQVPASAISQSNELWLVTPDNILHKTPANILLRSGDKVYLTATTELQHSKIVSTALASYLPGMQVEPLNSSRTSDELASSDAPTEVQP